MKEWRGVIQKEILLSGLMFHGDFPFLSPSDQCVLGEEGPFLPMFAHELENRNLPPFFLRFWLLGPKSKTRITTRAEHCFLAAFGKERFGNASLFLFPCVLLVLPRKR